MMPFPSVAILASSLVDGKRCFDRGSGFQGGGLSIDLSLQSCDAYRCRGRCRRHDD